MKKRHFLSYETRKSLPGYLFCAPFIIGFLFIFANTFIFSFKLSFNEVVPEQNGYSLLFKGLEYYNFALFEDAEFIPNLVASVGELLKDLIIIMIYSLFVAVLLNQNLRGKGIIRMIFFLPVITSTGVIAALEASDLLTNAVLLGETSTSVNLSGEQLQLMDFIKNIVQASNIGSQYTTILFEAVNDIYDIVTHSGVQIVIFLAGLQSISPSIHEAAIVEGCTAWEKFWKIILPLVSPLILVNTVWTIVDFFLSPSNKVMDTILKYFNAAQYGLSAAMSFINFLVMAAVVFLLLFLVNHVVFYENS